MDAVRILTMLLVVEILGLANQMPQCTQIDLVDGDGERRVERERKGMQRVKKI